MSSAPSTETIIVLNVRARGSTLSREVVELKAHTSFRLKLMMRMRAIGPKRRRFSVGVSLAAVIAMAASAISPLDAAQATGLNPSLLTMVPCSSGMYFVDANGVAAYGGPGQYTDSNFNLINGGNCSGAVVLDSTVTSIDANAFVDAAVTSVTFSSTITSIGEAAFANTGLTQVTIPDSVVTIARSAFSGAPISNLNLGASVASIGNSAFNVAPITSLTLPGSLASIGSSAFAAATLSSLVIPSSVSSIGSSAFRNSPFSSLSVYSPALTLGNSTFLATGSNLRCFYNFGNATFTSAALTAAALPNPCVIHFISTSVGANGSLSGTYSYIDDGASPSYTFTPASGYMVDSVSVDSTDVTDHLVAGSGQIRSYTFSAVTADHRIAVNFKVIPPAAPNPTASVPSPAPPVVAPTPEPTPTPTSTPTPTPTPTASPTPTAPAAIISVRVTGFEPGSAKLNSAAKRFLAKQATKLTSAKRILVTGFSQGPNVLKSDYALSLKRAKTVRAHLLTLLGNDVHITVASKQSTQVGSHYRAAQIFAVG
jgi:outer membrane protein OmpA-like peptidoglycan-associated protein